MKKIIATLFILALLALSGCGASYTEVEQQQYSSGMGYVLSLPADWVMTQEDDELTSFTSADGSIVLNISSELAGMDYYSLEELGDMLFDDLRQQLLDSPSSASGGDMNETGNGYYRTISGTDKEGRELTAAIYVYEPYTSVRWYLVFIADSGAFNNNKHVVSGIINSLAADMTADEIYELTMDINYPPASPEPEE